MLKKELEKYLFKIVMPLEEARRQLSERDLMDEMEVASRNFYHFFKKNQGQDLKKNFFFTLMGRNRITFLTEMLLFFVVSNSVKLTCILYFAANALSKKCLGYIAKRKRQTTQKKSYRSSVSHTSTCNVCNKSFESFISNTYLVT